MTFESWPGNKDVDGTSRERNNKEDRDYEVYYLERRKQAAKNISRSKECSKQTLLTFDSTILCITSQSLYPLKFWKRTTPCYLTVLPCRMTAIWPLQILESALLKVSAPTNVQLCQNICLQISGPCYMFCERMWYKVKRHYRVSGVHGAHSRGLINIFLNENVQWNFFPWSCHAICTRETEDIRCEKKGFSLTLMTSLNREFTS